MSDIVRITHPERDRTLTVPANLFPGRLASKGWQLADWQPETAPSEGSFVEYQEQALDNKARLQAEASALGIDVDRRWGVKRLQAEIARATEAPE